METIHSVGLETWSILAIFGLIMYRSNLQLRKKPHLKTTVWFSEKLAYCVNYICFIILINQADKSKQIKQNNQRVVAITKNRWLWFL